LERAAEKPENIFQIFFKGLILYLKKFLSFSRVMLFPVFGQVVGIFLILGPVYYYRREILADMPPEQIQQNTLFILLILILIVTPGFIIFLKAFWDYMIAMVSLNSMTAGILEKNSFGNFKSHNEEVKSRSGAYVVLLFILMGVWLVLLAAPFIVFILSFILLPKLISIVIFVLSSLVCLLILAVVSVYLSLSFQIFAFEDINPVGVIKKSFSMIKSNFWRVVVLGVLLFIITGVIAPFAIQVLAKNSPVLAYMAVPFNAYLDILSENPLVSGLIQELSYYIPDMGRELALSVIGIIVTAFILPLGSACFTLLYLDIKNK